AVDRLAGAHLPVQRLQHQSIAAEGHHDVGFLRCAIAVNLRQLRERGLRFGHGARDKGNLVVSLGSTHQLEARCRRDNGLGPRRLYIQAALVEVGCVAFASKTVNGMVGLGQLHGADPRPRTWLADGVHMSQFPDTTAAMAASPRERHGFLPWPRTVGENKSCAWRYRFSAPSVSWFCSVRRSQAPAPM